MVTPVAGHRDRFRDLPNLHRDGDGCGFGDPYDDVRHYCFGKAGHGRFESVRSDRQKGCGEIAGVIGNQSALGDVRGLVYDRHRSTGENRTGCVFDGACNGSSGAALGKPESGDHEHKSQQAKGSSRTAYGTTQPP